MTYETINLIRMITIIATIVIELILGTLLFCIIRKNKKEKTRKKQMIPAQNSMQPIGNEPVYNPTDTRPYLTHESMQAELNQESMPQTAVGGEKKTEPVLPKIQQIPESQNWMQNPQNVSQRIVAAESEKRISKWYLEGINGYFKEDRVQLNGRQRIGRDASKCQIVYPVNYRGISGLHCELEVTASGIILRDCNSSYGTFDANHMQLFAGHNACLKNGETFYLVNKTEEFRVVEEFID